MRESLLIVSLCQTKSLLGFLAVSGRRCFAEMKHPSSDLGLNS
jgi:hypothetical protein